MAKEILLVYQDCYDCHGNKSWYEKTKAKADENSIILRPVPFNAPGAKAMILDAAKRGCERLPFLTDGNKKYSYNVDKFIPKPEETPAEAEASPATAKAMTKKGKKYGRKTKAS